MRLEEAKNSLLTMLPNLQVLSSLNYFECDRSDPEDRSDEQIMEQIAFKLKDAVSLIEYLNKPIKAEGILTRKLDGRYWIKGTDIYFQTGSVIEVWDDIDSQFHKTHIGRNGKNYYAIGFKKPLEGMRVRCR